MEVEGRWRGGGRDVEGRWRGVEGARGPLARVSYQLEGGGQLHPVERRSPGQQPLEQLSEGPPVRPAPFLQEGGDEGQCLGREGIEDDRGQARGGGIGGGLLVEGSDLRAARVDLDDPPRRLRCGQIVISAGEIDISRREVVISEKRARSKRGCEIVDPIVIN